MLPPPGFMPPPGMPMPPPPAPAPSAGPSSLPLQPPRQVREKVAPSTVTLKPGTLLVYGDNDVSPVRLIPSLSFQGLRLISILRVM